jgi:hypothetical protein
MYYAIADIHAIADILWRGHRVGLVGTGVKQEDPAGALFFAVSTFELFEAILDAAEKLVRSSFR